MEALDSDPADLLFFATDACKSVSRDGLLLARSGGRHWITGAHNRLGKWGSYQGVNSHTHHGRGSHVE